MLNNSVSVSLLLITERCFMMVRFLTLLKNMQNIKLLVLFLKKKLREASLKNSEKLLGLKEQKYYCQYHEKHPVKLRRSYWIPLRLKISILKNQISKILFMMFFHTTKDK